MYKMYISFKNGDFLFFPPMCPLQWAFLTPTAEANYKTSLTEVVTMK